MNPGQLDRRITIQSKTSTQDANYGTLSDTWTTVLPRIAASVKDILQKKSESSADNIRVATQSKRVRIRYRNGITSDMRVIIHENTDVIAQIVSGPAEIGKHQYLEMIVEAYSS